MFRIYGKEGCGSCQKLIMVMELLGKEYDYLILGDDFTEDEFEEKFPNKTLLPQVEHDGTYIGNGNETVQYLKEHRIF
tara:strand:- start:9698 stop:9931 length:234 start_codon:yes stop_codon:yes gene_type:complete